MFVIGPYEMLGKVAQSASASVWKAHDPLLDRDVAVKQVDRNGDSESLHQEAAVLARLDHPNIVGVIDIIVADGMAWLVEEWVDGATLGAVRDHSGRLSAEQAMGVIRGALLGLIHAHDRDIIHGDIAPGNILVDRDGISKLVDFGSGSGTAGYRSPEVAAGQPAGKPADVYSAAAVLADLLGEGAPVRHGAAVAAPTPGSGPIGQVLRKALAADPAARHADARALLADLEYAAERSLGPGWLSLAGVSGLVSATLSGTAVAAIEVGGATSTIITGSAIAGSAPAAALPGVIAGAPIKPLIPVVIPDTQSAADAASAPSGFTQPTVVPAADKAAEPPPKDINIDADTGPEFTQASYSDRSGPGRADPPAPITSTPSGPAPAGPKSPPAKWIAIGVGAAATAAIIIAAVLLTRPGTADTGTAADSSAAPSAAASTGPGASASVTGSISASAGADPSAGAISVSATSVSASPSPTVPVAAPPAGFNGTYSVNSIVTAATGAYADELGETSSNTWTVTSPCTDGTCDATISSTSGLSMVLIPSGGRYSATLNETAECVDSETLELSGDVVPTEAIYDLEATVADGTVVALTGQSTGAQTAPCSNQVDVFASTTRQITVTRTGS